VLNFSINGYIIYLQFLFDVQRNIIQKKVINVYISSCSCCFFFSNCHSSTAWIITGVYKMENVKTSPTFNSTFYMIKTDGTSKHTHSIYDFKVNADPIVNTSNNSTILNGTAQ
jgi:hypothetical protein